MDRMLDELDRRLLDAVPSYRDAYNRGKSEGREEGRQEGREEGRQVVEAMLRKLVMKHLGRGLVPSEEEALERRAKELDRDKAVEVVSMPNEAFVKWLLGSEGEGKI